MKLTFLGTGSAFTLGYDNFQSNLMLEHNGDRMLIDCGSDARHALYKLNLDYHDIRSVYISHLHADHAGGLEWLGFARKFHPECEKPNLYIHETMVDKVWDNMLAAGMRSIKDIECNLATYFNTTAITETFKWQDVNFQCIQTVHVFDNDKQQPCYALFFKINDISVFFTADAAFTPERFMPYYQQADYIFHDCETTPDKSGVHAHFTELCELDLKIREKMWLYHYNPLPLPDHRPYGFKGFVMPRQVFNFDDVTTFKG